MNVPTRIQRLRKAGSTTPPDTKYCGRPGKWGNPFSVHQISHQVWRVTVNVPDKEPMKKTLCVQILIKNGRSFFADKKQAQEHAAMLFACLLREAPLAYQVQELVGYKHLSCWCALDAPCHVEKIIEEIKNQQQ